MAGTASTVRSWLLLEHPGSWGRHALSGNRLPEGLGRELSVRCRAAGVRPLLIRRVAGGQAGGTCFAIRSGPEPPWIERVRLERIEGSLDLDIEALGRAERLGLESHAEALFLVCTHGRHDPCCAERGRPLAQAFANAFPTQTWESSHVGGDRFAGNLVAFPHGLYFGRVGPDDVTTVASSYLEGTISVEHFRGRSCRSMPVQAAEHALRLATGFVGIDEVTLEAGQRVGDEVVATFRTPNGRSIVRVAIQDATPRFLTCHSAAEEIAPAYRLLSIEPGG